MHRCNLLEEAKLQASATVLLPALQEGMSRLKQVIIEIAKHETSDLDRMLFVVEERQHLRRLAGLGVLAHQPAIAGQCKITDEERLEVATRIVQQKVGIKPKTIKAVEDFLKHQAATRGLMAPSPPAATSI